jgi:hypothetical protein
MDGLRFVLEAPQLSQTHKKRPRLVTSCDNWCVARSRLSLVEFAHPSLRFFQHSRLKKIKCVQIKAQPRCEACEAGNTPCQFRDRERYFAERSRIVTGASAGSSPAHSRRSSSSQSTEPSAIPPPTRGDSVDASGWYSGAQASSDHGHPSRYASSSPSYSLSSSPQSNPDQWFSSPLVEPARLHYERSARLTPDSYGRTCLTLSITSCLGNPHTLHPYLKLATAPPAAIILITPSKMHRVHSVTALPRARHLHYLILVMAQCLTQRCSCTSSRCSLSASPETSPSFNSTMSPVACSMAPCRRCWQTV